MNKAVLAGREAIEVPARDGERRRGIDRVIAVLEALQRQGAPMRVGDLARVLNAPRSTTYEIVNRLLDADMLESVGAPGHVYFGRAMHLFGHAYAEHSALFRRAGEALDRLAAETGATAQLCALRGRKYTILDHRAGAGLFRITSDVGMEVPLPWTASGRLFLGHLADAAILAFVPPEDFRLPDGRWLPPADFLADVERARRDGCCETTGLADRFTYCLAAPVRDDGGANTMTLCLVVPVDTPEGRRRELLAMLRERSESLSAIAA